MNKKLLSFGMAAALLLMPNTVKAEKIEKEQMYVIANSGLNIRTEGSLDADIITALPKGEEIKVISKDDSEWHEIEYKDIKGYMYARWLSNEKPTVEPVHKPVNQAKNSSVPAASNASGRLYGTCTITHYCNCAKCCGSYGNATASGATPRPNHTIAMGGNIPFGTKVRIGNNPTIYTVEDRGGAIGSHNIDVFVGSHSEALSRGRYSAPVYIIE